MPINIGIILSIISLQLILLCPEKETVTVRTTIHVPADNLLHKSPNNTQFITIYGPDCLTKSVVGEGLVQILKRGILQSPTLSGTGDETGKPRRFKYLESPALTIEFISSKSLYESREQWG